jgi:HD-GYP domain-containing protein (c-di-GMP phosphodiesterase class II)
MALLKRVAGAELDRLLVGVFLKNMRKELADKPVVLSNGSVAVVGEIDYDDIEFPVVVQYGRQIKTGKHLFCTSMY